MQPLIASPLVRLEHSSLGDFSVLVSFPGGLPSARTSFSEAIRSDSQPSVNRSPVPSSAAWRQPTSCQPPPKLHLPLLDASRRVGMQVGFSDSQSARISPEASLAAGLTPNLPSRRNTFRCATLGTHLRTRRVTTDTCFSCPTHEQT